MTFDFRYSTKKQNYAETAERKCEYCNGFHQNATVANDFDGANYCHWNHGFGGNFDVGFGFRKYYFREFFFNGLEYFSMSQYDASAQINRNNSIEKVNPIISYPQAKAFQEKYQYPYTTTSLSFTATATAEIKFENKKQIQIFRFWELTKISWSILVWKHN